MDEKVGHCLWPVSLGHERYTSGLQTAWLPRSKAVLLPPWQWPCIHEVRSSMLLFMAVESQLSERYAGSQFSHTVRRENHSVTVVTTDSCICLFNIQIGGGHSSPSNNVID